MGTKIRNVSGEALTVPWLGHRNVEADEVVEVDDKQADSFLSQSETWSEVGATRKSTTKKGDS